MSNTTDSDFELDPFFLHARREAIVIFLVWFIAMLWAVPYCYFTGYGVEDPANIPTLFGVPSWIVWGFGLPWLVADLFTTWFCFSFMKDGDLGTAGDEDESHQQHVANGEESP